MRICTATGPAFGGYDLTDADAPTGALRLSSVTRKGG